MHGVPDRGNEQDFDWRSEFECEQCKAWQGKPPVPIRKARELLESQGLRDFQLEHACLLRENTEGGSDHVPTTVLRAGGVETQWIPEMRPGMNRLA